MQTLHVIRTSSSLALTIYGFFHETERITRTHVIGTYVFITSHKTLESIKLLLRFLTRHG